MSATRANDQVEPSQHVELFQEDDVPSDPRGKLQYAVTYATNTLFTGETRMKVNPAFKAQVTDAVPLEQPVVVVCQTGQRSLCAADVLRLYGYEKVAWMKGGFNACKGGNFERSSFGVTLGEGCEGLKYAGIAGVGKLLGATDVQRAEPGGDIRYYAKVGAAFILFDLLVYFLL